MADAFALSHRCVLHLDLDSFFLAVHKRRDPTLPLDSKPVVRYQFQAVIWRGAVLSARKPEFQNRRIKEITRIVAGKRARGAICPFQTRCKTYD